MNSETELRLLRKLEKINEEVDDLTERQRLTDTQMRYLIEDVSACRNMIDDIVKERQKEAQAQRLREQFFIDAVVRMEQLVRQIQNDAQMAMAKK